MPEEFPVSMGMPRHLEPRRIHWLPASALVLSLGITTLMACATTTNTTRPLAPAASSPSGNLVQQWGVEIIALRASSAGYMLDFRYRVKDAEKAAPLLKQEAKVYLIVEKNGAQLYVPVVSRIGPLRQSSLKAYVNQSYFVLFANPGKLVLPGDVVTVVIGDFKAEHLIVDQS